MITHHDPLRHIRALRAAMASDKRPIAFLIGAGCPLAIRVSKAAGGTEPLIPDIRGLTVAVSTAVISNASLAPLLTTVLEHLKKDGITDPNIEHILSHVRNLRQAAGQRDVYGITSTALSQFDASLCEEIDKCVRRPLPSRESPYHFLAAWINAIPRTDAIELFTTNYDLLMEQALEELSVPFFDGFVGSYKTFFDPSSLDAGLPASWARVWKLHGSINWRHDSTTGVVSRNDSLTSATRMIHPSHLKYEESRRMPFLAMIDRLKGFLRKPTALLVTCGYSYGDQHLNEVILEGLQGNSSAAAFACLFGKLKDYPPAGECAKRRSNLTVIAEDNGIIGCMDRPWQVPNPDDLAVESPFLSVVDDPTTNTHACRFHLGDFSSLAGFLHSQLGTREEP